MTKIAIKHEFSILFSHKPYYCTIWKKNLNMKIEKQLKTATQINKFIENYNIKNARSRLSQTLP